MREEPKNQNDIYSNDETALLRECTICPRECRIDRFAGRLGYCRMDAGLNIASICIHRGEEPPISGPDGICNIFFGGCNLRCRYCQNYEISRPGSLFRTGFTDLKDTLDHIEKILTTGIRAVGFVSPSHVIPQMMAIIRGIKARGLKPIFVYNTNGYDKQSTIRKLEGLIDVYLPDFKYVSSGLSNEYSDAGNYPEVALQTLKEMYYQKGSVLSTGDDGLAENGMLIRHLVLPGHADESKKVIETIARELSTGVHLSLMSQYHPTEYVVNHPILGRTLYENEYREVVDFMESLGFRNGWIQEMDSYRNYKPDFKKENPFE